MKKLTYIIVFLTLIALGIFLLNRSSGNSSTLKLADGKVIAIANTDDNTGEDIIIKSDKADYKNATSSEVYLSISGGKSDENISVQFLFPNDGSQIEKVEMKNGDSWKELEVKTEILNYEHKKPVPESLQSLGYVSIPSTNYQLLSANYFRLTITYPADTVGEFWVEALGDKGSYGLLDPSYGYNSSLIGHWKFDEGSGTTAGDSSGNKNTGTITGATWTSGKLGKALSFSGSGQYISTNYVQTSVTAYTISAWVKVPTSANQFATIVQDRGGSGSSLTFGIDGSGGCDGSSCISPGKLLFIDNKAVGYIGVGGNVNLRDNQWHHVVGTWAANSGTAISPSQFSLYIDGTLENSPQTINIGSDTSPLTGSNGTQIGYHANWVSYFNGSIDDIRIYNRALTQDEITKLYQSGQTTITRSNNFSKDSGVKAYFRFEPGHLTKDEVSGNESFLTNTNVTSDTSNFFEGLGGAYFSRWTDPVAHFTTTDANLPSGFPLKSGGSNGSFSVAFFWQPNGSAMDYSNIWTKMEDYGVGSGFAIRFMSDEKLAFVMQNTSGGNEDQPSFPVAFSAGNKYFCVVTYDRVTKAYRIHVYDLTNNKLLAPDVTGVTSYQLPASNSGTFYIGGTDYYSLNGTLDSMVVSNRVWTPEEINQIRNQMYGHLATLNSSQPAQDWVCGTGVINDSRDNKTYATVKIGNQCWMKQGLNVGTRVDGGTLQDGYTAGTCTTIKKWCYDNTDANCDSNANPTYPDGGLYQWDQAMCGSTTEGAQGICPTGWHIPTEADFCTLEQTLDSTVNCSTEGYIGTDVGTKLKPGGSSGWEGNLAGDKNGPFEYRGDAVYFWSSLQFSTDAWYRYLGSGSDQVYRSHNTKNMGNPVRCVRDTVGAVANNSLTNGLVGWWTFDGKDISGATATDRSGNGNSGTITGATTAIGKLGQALKFDGSSSYVSMGNPSSLQLGTSGKPLTASIWVKAQSLSSNANALTKENAFAIGPSGNNFSVGIWGLSRSGTKIWSLNRWYHVVLTWNGVDKVELFVDGESDGSSTGSSAAGDGGNFEIGRRVGFSTFDGSIDDVRIYNRALSASEVKQLYNMGQAVIKK